MFFIGWIKLKIILIVMILTIIMGVYLSLNQESNSALIEEKKSAKSNENKSITIEYSKSKIIEKKKVSLLKLQKQTETSLKKDSPKKLTSEQERMKSQYEAHETMRKENNRVWQRDQQFYKMHAERQKKIGQMNNVQNKIKTSNKEN